MPFVSRAQQGYFNANKSKLEKQGVDVNEWNAASKGEKGLPERVGMPLGESKPAKSLAKRLGKV